MKFVQIAATAVFASTANAFGKWTTFSCVESRNFEIVILVSYFCGQIREKKNTF